MSPTKPDKRKPADEQAKKEWLSQNKPTVGETMDIRGTRPIRAR